MRNLAKTEVEAAGNMHGIIVLITGGGSGFGRDTALACARKGAKVIVTGRSLAKLKETIEICRAEGWECTAPDFSVDVSSYHQQKEMFDFVDDSFGRPPDVVVVNAGIAKDEHSMDETDRVTESCSATHPPPADFQVVDVNMTGALDTAELAQVYWAKHDHERWMPRRKLLLVGSTTSLNNLSTGYSYTAGKHALIGYWKALSARPSPLTFDCHIFCPTFSITSLLDPADLIMVAGFPLVQSSDVAAAMCAVAADTTLSQGVSAHVGWRSDRHGGDRVQSSRRKLVTELEDAVMASSLGSANPPSYSLIMRDMLKNAGVTATFSTLSAPFIFMGIISATILGVNKLSIPTATGCGVALGALVSFL